MRSHAKASTAGSTQRQAKSLGRFFRGALATRGASPASKGSGAPAAKRLLLPASVFAAILALMALALPAGASKTHLFKEVFGSAAQPSFSAPRGMTLDQGAGQVLVIDAGSPPSVKRYSLNGTAANFSATGTNAIDGTGAGDGTPQGSLAFGAANRVQIAVDESGGATDGNIYVAQAAAKLVDVFSSTGAYLGQLTASTGGPFGEICGVAVDSAGAVYVGDIAGKVHKYVPAANPPVNADNTASFSTVATPCQIAAGTGPTAGFIFVNRSSGQLMKVDSATGESKYQLGTSHRTVAVDPATGHVYAPRLTGSSSEVVKYDASGAGSSTIVSSFKPGSTIEGAAVRQSGSDVYVTRSSISTVQVYGPTVTVPDVLTSPATNNTGTRATLNGTVNPDGVGLTECKFEYGTTTSYGQSVPCAETPAAIGTGTSPVSVHADISGLKPNGTQYNFRLVAKNANGTVNGSNLSFTTPNTVITAAATGISPTEATLNGTVNPDTAAISECVFEWGLPKESGESIQKFPEAAPCVPGPGGIGTGTSPVAVSANLSGLHPGTTYVYRLKAVYPTGAVFGSQMSVQTTGPVIAAAWSEGVIRTEATLKAEIDPEGQATTYRFEYGTTEAYGQETPELAVGSDSTVHEVTRFLSGLQPGTTYHYRVIATNVTAVNEGPDQTFTTYEPFAPDESCPNTTFRTGPALNLADCRGYEMVSPVDKNGGDIKVLPNTLNQRTSYFQASLDGEKITYSSEFSFGDQPSNHWSNQYIASRGPGGWTTDGINAPQSTTLFDPEYTGLDTNTFFLAFAPDLSSAWLWDFNKTPLTPDGNAGYTNLYRRDNLSGSFEALTNHEPVGGSSPGEFGYYFEYHVEGFSADLSKVFFSAAEPFTPDAHPTSTAKQLYEFSGGDHHLVSVLPNGTPSPARSVIGNGGKPGYGDGPQLENAVSDDGSRVFWTSNAGGTASLHVRINAANEQSALAGGECTEPTKACTIGLSDAVSASGFTSFETASADGSRVLFSVPNSGNRSLYDFDVETETPTLITDDSEGVLGASADLSRFYFASYEDLAPGATAGEANIYLHEEGTNTFIATVTDDEVNRFHKAGGIAPAFQLGDLGRASGSRVTSDGRYLAFMSMRSLTGYDHADAVTGEPNAEIFRYDADTGELICVSCNPSGARSVGNRLPAPWTQPELVGRSETRAAAWIPGFERELHGTRALSDDGKVFFNSYDALVPGDTNGVMDVYEWEAQGDGSCPKPGGCISLTSTGQSAEESELIDASADGEEVFFTTGSSIAPQDLGSVDLYVAKVNGGFPPPPSLPDCLGDACQSIPPAPNDPTPASASFRGAGDPVAAKPRRRCRARSRNATKSKAKRKKAKRCTRAKRRAKR